MTSGQLPLPFPKTKGGRREGAGRKPSGSRAGVSHLTRPFISREEPLHVTLRMARGLPILRQEILVRALRRALGAGKERFGLRVVHYSIQDDHLHLVVEAPDRAALSRGMHGLGVRLARAINRAVQRRGKVLGDRYHARALGSPTEVRNVLAYVLLNRRKHSPAARSAYLSWDVASTALVFDGWRVAPVDVPDALRDVIAASRASPEVWLLKRGWRRAGGPIDPRAVPSAGRAG